MPPDHTPIKIVPAGEEALIIYLAEQPDEAVLDRVHLLKDYLADRLSSAATDLIVTDLVPSFASLTLYYDVTTADYQSLHNQLLQLIEELPEQVEESRNIRELEIPVYYGAEVAPDLQRVSDITGLSAQEIIAAHSRQPYRVYALGFRPGFAYMGTLPRELSVPRHATPRQQVPRGAVAIAEGQTAVYPSSSPGGWNLIGRCPLPMFECRDGKPAPLLQVGDRARFRQVGRDEFLQLGGELSP